jgi:AraC-like DNA-binding protein
MHRVLKHWPIYLHIVGLQYMELPPSTSTPVSIQILPDPISVFESRSLRAYLWAMSDLLASMTRRVIRIVNGFQPETLVPRLGLAVIGQQSEPETGSFGPLISVVLQGAKELVVGDRRLRYGAGACFCATIEVHTSGCIVTASPQKPYVAVSMSLDQDKLAELLASLPQLSVSDEATTFAAMPASRQLLEALDHLIALLETPDDIDLLAQSREREVIYRLLQSAHGPMLWQFARQQSRLMRVKRAVDWIKVHFDQRQPTQRLADMASMSIPSFHRHFKAATAMTPLQYQKAVRLQAARRLLLENVDVARTAYAVGYESPSQFSREYTRFFCVRPSKESSQIGRLPHVVHSRGH